MNETGQRVIDSSLIYKLKRRETLTPIRLSQIDCKKLPNLNRKKTPLKDLIKSIDKHNRFPSPERFKIREAQGITGTHSGILIINSYNPQIQRDRSAETPTKTYEELAALWAAKKKYKDYKSVSVANVLTTSLPRKTRQLSKDKETPKTSNQVPTESTVRIHKLIPTIKSMQQVQSTSRPRIKSVVHTHYTEKQEPVSDRHSRLNHYYQEFNLKPVKKLSDTLHCEADTELLTGW